MMKMYLFLLVIITAACTACQSSAQTTQAVTSTTETSSTVTLAQQMDTETPIPNEITVPTSTQPTPMETVTFTTEDGVQLAGSLFGEGESAVILAHQGTPGTDQTSWYTFGELLGERGFAALTFDFRGIGQSEGAINYSALDQDVAAALQFLRDRGYENIVCVGASMGGTACIRVALNDEFAGLATLGSTMLAGGGNGLRVTQDDIALLALPKLFITAAADSFNVVDHTTRMYELSSDPKELHLLPGKEHGTDLFNTDASEELATILLDFLENLPVSPAISQSATTPALGDTLTRPNDEAAMLYIPAGTFQMGSTEAEITDAIDLCQQHYNICNRWYYERESPQHPVPLDGFWIDRTEITNAQYRQCVETGICTEPSTCKKGQATYTDADKNDHPVVCVNWEEAQTYCQWTGARLPTEAEWEYAFRGGTGSIYPWGDEFDGSRLNYCDANCSESHADNPFDDGYPQTAPAGTYPQGASWSGVLDMGGNVSEWVSDWFGDYSPGAESNPDGPPTGSEKMVKGCSWFFHPTYCRGAARASVDPGTRLDYLGFRCVVTVSQETEGVTDMVLGPTMVPTGNSPTIDGTLSPGEWENATVETFADGSELFLMHADGYLYLGIRANTPGMIVGNIFVQRGDEISILHSSAALGTAIYQKGVDSWQQVQDFSWQCRDTSNSDTALAKRETFLQQEGWVATNSRIGIPNELEYQIKITDQNLRLAVNFIRASNTNQKIPWPPELSDDCVKPTPGGLPENLYFSLEQWGTLEVSK